MEVENEKPIQLIKCDQSNLSVNQIALNRIRDLLDISSGIKFIIKKIKMLIKYKIILNYSRVLTVLESRH